MGRSSFLGKCDTVAKTSGGQVAGGLFVVADQVQSGRSERVRLRVGERFGAPPVR